MSTIPWHIGVLVPARNEEALLPRCIVSILAARTRLPEEVTCDVVVVVDDAGEVELCGQELVAGGGHLDVDVGRTPGVPAGSGDESAAGAVGGDLVRRRLHGVDLEAAVVGGRERRAQVPLRDAGGEL